MINVNNNVITIHTKNTSYQMIVNEYNILQHAYYGSKLNLEDDMSYTISKTQYGFSGNIYESLHVRHFSLDTLPQEITSCGVGDYRINSIGVINNDKTYAIDLRYVKHEVTKETKDYKMPNLRGYSEILKIYLKDTVKNIDVILYYKVIEEFDVISRYAEVINNEKEDIIIDKMMSLSIDLKEDEYDLIHFHGAHAYERQFQRVPLSNGVRSIGSTRGNSSHHHNPFAIITNKNTTEDTGDCYSFAFVYSGTFLFETEVNYLNTLRVQMGINPNNFEIQLKNKESFVTPEVAMCYTNKGLNEHTNLWTNAVKNCVIRKQFLTDLE